MQKPIGWKASRFRVALIPAALVAYSMPSDSPGQEGAANDGDGIALRGTCSLELPGQCHAFAGGGGGGSFVFGLRADDFVPTSTTIGELCWWGDYYDVSLGEYCGPGPGDDFIVTVFADAGGYPGSIVATRAVTPTKSEVEFPSYVYSASLAPAISGLTAGTRYWLEIHNDAPGGDCGWNWLSGAAGNSYSVQNSGDSYEPEDDFQTVDLAFCLDSTIAADDGGDVTGRCCYDPPGPPAGCPYTCDLLMLAACPGLWRPGGSCDAGTCSPPAHDDCSAALAVTDLEVPFQSICATDVGPDAVPACDVAATDIVRDLWFKYVAASTTTLTVSLCADTYFDSVIAAYSNGTSACSCPTDNTQLIDCNDEGCTVGGPFGRPGTLTFPVVAGKCYLLRVGGWPGGGDEHGFGVVSMSEAGVPDCNENGIDDSLDILNCSGSPACDDCNKNDVPDECDLATCEDASCYDCDMNEVPDGCQITDNPLLDVDLSGVLDECEVIQPDPTGTRKNRFLSFVPVRLPGEFAIRVRMVSLQHPVPPNDPSQAPTNYSAFETDTCTDPGCCIRWVGPPAQWPDSGPPLNTTYMGAQLQCAPHYQNWSGNDLLHVTGREIMPDSVYDVQYITEGNDTAVEANYSAPLTLQTARRGDIVRPIQDVSSPIIAQPDAFDLIASFDKVLQLDGSLTEHQAWLKDNVPNPAGSLINVIDLAQLADAVAGRRYPYAGPSNCPTVAVCPTARVCGNGSLDAGEECDDSNYLPSDGCDPACRSEVCGNGLLQAAEQCDDGNATPGDGCEPDCSNTPVCGNCLIDDGEQCDDGNAASGDGCDASCQVEGTPSARVEMVPIAPPNGAYPAGVVISNQTISAPPGPLRVWLELRLSGWGPDRLRGYEARISPGSLLGANATPPNPGVNLVTAVEACTVNSQCVNAVGPGSSCASNSCQSAVINQTDPEWVGAAGVFYFWVRIPSAMPSIGPTLTSAGADDIAEPAAVDNGGTYYGGSVVLDVPGSALGEYVLSFDPDATMLIGSTDCRMPISGSPAVIKILNDCNQNGVEDACDLDCGAPAGPCDVPGCGGSADCDSAGWPGNGIPDECDIDNCTGDSGCADCNVNQIPDGCEGAVCQSFTAGCDPSIDWSCGNNWNLAGQYPDNVASAPNVPVDLESGDDVFLDVNATIASLLLENGSTLHVTQTGTGNLTVEGNMEVGGELLVDNDRAINVSGAYVAVVPEGLYAKDSGALGERAQGGTATASLSVNNLDLSYFQCSSECPNGGAVCLSEDMSVTVAGDLKIGARQAKTAVCGQSDTVCVAAPRPASRAAGGYTPPILRALGSSIIYVTNDVSLYGLGELVLQPDIFRDAALVVGGNLVNEITDPACFDVATGGITLNGGGTQVFEAASTDMGETGARGAANSNFMVGRIEVTAGTPEQPHTVIFRDSFDNNRLGIGFCDEAVYVGELVLAANTQIILDSCRLYYQVLVADETAEISMQECGALIELPAVPAGLTPEPGGSDTGRMAAVVVPPPSSNRSQATELTALRVRLTTLNHPRFCCTDGTGASCSGTTCDVDSHCAAVPGGNQACAHQATAGVPDYTAMQDNIRYVNSFTFPAEGGSLDCPDDGPPFNTSYKCATLGCEPEYRDWAVELATPGPNQPQIPGLIYITGDAVVPSSTLEISHIAASCGTAASANTCTSASAPLAVGTARWGDLNGAGFTAPDGKSDVLDIPPIVNKLKTVSPIFPEPRLWLKQRDPRPDSDAITVIDLSDVVDGGPQAKPYPASRTVDACPHD